MAKNVAESIKQRLLNLAKARKEDFNFVLRQYVLQRLMYRIGISDFAEDFLLKGGLLFWVWNEDFHRPTQDMDLLGFGDSSIDTVFDKFIQIIQEACADGLVFHTLTLKAEDIKEETSYSGIRVTGTASLGQAKIPYQIDIGFGDAVIETAERQNIPAFLDDLPKPSLKIYPVETVIAEKFQAMVMLGDANSRMKDFYDIVFLANKLLLNRTALGNAIKATFDRRETQLADAGLVIFSDPFKLDKGKHKQWDAFIKKNRLTNTQTFEQVVTQLQLLLEPVCQQLLNNTLDNNHWDVQANTWK